MQFFRTNTFQTQDYSYLTIWTVHKLQCLCFMHDICSNVVHISYFSLATNNMIHSHFTRASANIHINVVSSLDKRNFVYNCALLWNECDSSVRALSKHAFLQQSKT